VESTLEQRLGRPLDPAKANLGRLLFFDEFVGLHGDNSCAGCHSPLNGFGDSRSMAIGVENNDFVGPRRAGPRNQRRTPAVVNTAFYPKLMWNGRFSAISGDPFDNSKGFLFPPPEGITRFQPNDPDFLHLLQAQAHIPPTELSEAAGFTDICGTTDTSSALVGWFCRDRPLLCLLSISSDPISTWPLPMECFYSPGRSFPIPKRCALIQV